MSRRIREVPSRTFIGAMAASTLLALALAPAAGAAKIYTCANKSGAMRLVSAKTKCKHGERKVSWNAAGPDGAQGAPGSPGVAGSPGAAGADGANGVGADYATDSFGPTLLSESEKGEVIVAKTIPAGSYLASATTTIGAGKGKGPVMMMILCELIDTPGTPSLVEPPAALDVGEWLQQLSNAGSEYEGASTLAMQGQLTTTEPTTLALVCAPVLGAKEATVDSFGSSVSALQTTANK
jgi:hypothetical protein